MHNKRDFLINLQREFEDSIINNDLEELQKILDSNLIDPSKNNCRSLVYACLENKTDVIKILLKDKRIDPSAQMNHSLKVIACHGNVEIVKLLLNDKRVNVNDKYVFSAIFNEKTFTNEHMEIAKLFLKHPKIEPTTDYATHYAIQIDSEELHDLFFPFPSVQKELKAYFPERYEVLYTKFFKNKIKDF
jgi:hypothetical protein